MTQDVATEDEIELLRHCLGCRSGVHKRNWGYRNGSCVSVGSSHDKAWSTMVAKQLAFAGDEINDGLSRYYHATEIGAVVAGISKARVKELFGTQSPNVNPQ